MMRRIVCAGVLLCLGLAFLGMGGRSFSGDDEDRWLRPLGPPPKANPRRISGGESFPPLPLPATPLRRSERKREPSAPKLIGKVVWGESASFQYESGEKVSVADWNMCPGDIKGLLAKSGHFIGTRYSHESVSLAGFHGDPEKTPVLFFSGGRTIRLDARQLESLRSYVLQGGLLVFDSIAGSPYFYQSAKARTLEMFPECEMRTVPADHPLYHMLYDIKEVSYPRNLDSTEPFLEGIYIGCRLAVIVSRYGLGCGWDGREVPLIDEAVYYAPESAGQIGVNMIAYAVGYANVGRAEAKPELFGVLDEKRPTNEFVFAQIRHEGAWNVHPGGAAALLRRLKADTSLRVSLKRVAVTLGTDDLTDYTFLYLAGLDDFRFSPAEVKALLDFLRGGGTLLVNNGLGLSTFDAAARRELARVLPGRALELIPSDHPLYSAAFPVGEVRYTPAVVHAEPGIASPRLYGISLEGDLRVIYSPYDLEAGWQGDEHPLCRGYEPHSAMQLGMNIAVYAATH